MWGEPTIYTPPKHPIKGRLKRIKFLFTHNLWPGPDTKGVTGH